MPMKMKNFISKDLFCSSPAATAICSSTDQRSIVRNGLKPLHRLDSKLNDHYKTFTNNFYQYYSSPSSRIPCSSELPLTPRPSHRLKTQKLVSVKQPNSVPRRKSSADVSDLRQDKYNGHSSRYLLGDSPVFDSFQGSDSEKSFALVPSTPVIRLKEREFRKSRSEKGRLGSIMDSYADKEKKDNKKATALTMVNHGDDQMVIKSDNKNMGSTKYGDSGQRQRQKSMWQCRDDDSRVMKSSSSARARDQVVVLRVSLHCKCKGCEAKLRKHLSKMEGVTSFSIDLEIKKVTVVGNVIPLDVLTSISKVKNAQFWPSPISTSSTTSSSSTSSTVNLSF